MKRNLNFCLATWAALRKFHGCILITKLGEMSNTDHANDSDFDKDVIASLTRSCNVEITPSLFFTAATGRTLFKKQRATGCGTRWDNLQTLPSFLLSHDLSVCDLVCCVVWITKLNKWALYHSVKILSAANLGESNKCACQIAAHALSQNTPVSIILSRGDGDWNILTTRNIPQDIQGFVCHLRLISCLWCIVTFILLTKFMLLHCSFNKTVLQILSTKCFETICSCQTSQSVHLTTLAGYLHVTRN